ncbi:MAG: hypothetical protein AAGB11_17545 [Pseudomonadota bacterium]
MSRSLLALGFLGAAVGLLWLLWQAAWGSLTNLPSKDQLESASTSVVDVVAPRSAPAPEPRQLSPPSNVRFVEKDGIVGVRVDGPLERAPSRVRVDPPAPKRIEPDRYKLVVIKSAGVIDARSHRIILAHIDAPDAEHRCERPDGLQWPCGRRARTALRRLIRRRAIECFDIKDDSIPANAPERPAVCRVANTDLSEWLVENGWASPADTAPDLWRQLHTEAQEQGLGVYAQNAR